MQEGHRAVVARYAGAIAAVALATLITASLPLLRDRLTFFAFWPVIFSAAWFLGIGPALLASLLSAVAVLLFMPPQNVAGPSYAVGLTVGVFLVAGATAAVLAVSRERADRRLRDSRNRFRLLASSAPALIWMAGPDSLCTFVNDSWLRFTGRALRDEIDEGWLEAVHPDDRAGCRAAYMPAFTERRPFSMEHRLRRHDGVYRSMLNSAVPRFADDGAFLGHIGSCVDITEQKEARQRAEEALEQAERASRAKDAFLATVSHELRTPLSPILAWARMLRDGQLAPQQAARAVEVIERNARNQAQLVEDLLDVSRIVEGRLRLNVRPVMLAAIVESAIETVRVAADAKGIRLQAVLDSTLSPIAGDPDRLRQIVWNLLSNAVKFTPKGGRVHVVLERVNSHVEIAVSDTGSGFDKDQLPHLFERFWQADPSATRAHTGLGLGLAIVRHLAELHGGTTVAESPGIDHGSTFTVKLPIVPLARAAGEEQRRHPAQPDDDPAPMRTRLDGLKVLVVDDEPDANEVMRTLLDHFGAEVRVAASAAQALEILSRWVPDVLVSDVGMPGQDGYALIREVRARRDAASGVPAVALTAFASVDDRVRLLSAGFQMHVAKPADPGEITAAIAAVAALGRRPQI